MTNRADGKWLESILGNQKTARRINAAVVTLMMACLGGTVAQFGARLDPAWDGSFMVWTCFLVSLESILTHQESFTFLERKQFGFRLAEWVGWLVVLKFIPYITNGLNALSRDLQAWQTNPLEFFTPEYLGLVAVSFLVWKLSGDFNADLEDLNADITDLSFEEGKLENSRSDARQHLVDRALFLGGIMALVTVASRLEENEIWGDRSLGPSTLLFLGLYLFLTLLLLSQTQFAVLRGQWLWHKITLSPSLASSWFKYGLVLLIVLTIISLLLPTTYTLGLLASLEQVLNFIWSFFLAVFSLITLPFRWLISLFDPSLRFEMEGEPGEPPELEEPTPDAGVLPWLEVLKSILFWAILIGLIGYTVWFYLRRIPQLSQFLANLRLVHWLKQAWTWLRRQTAGIMRSAAAAGRAVARTLRRPKTEGMPTRGPRFSFRQASPRQQVIYFYLRLVEKAAARGLVRLPSQTPRQFEQTLVSSLQEVETEVHGMTSVFLEARYSRHPVAEEQTNLVRRLWNRIMRAFRSLRSSKP